jgi:hypothetical protein
MPRRKRTYPAELAQRASDGIEVTLYWHGGTELSVHVHDTRTGMAFDIPAPADHALDVFHHPFAHAPVFDPEPLAVVEEPEESLPGR